MGLLYATVMSCLSDRTRLRLTTTTNPHQFHAQGTIPYNEIHSKPEGGAYSSPVDRF